MKKFTIYDSEGKILRSGFCTTTSFKKKAGNGEFIFEGIGNDVTQKIEFDGFDDNGQPIDPRVVDKTPEEKEENSLPKKVKSAEQQPASITNKQWQDVLKRLDDLEKRQ